MTRTARFGFLLLVLAPLACLPGAFTHDDVLKRPLVATAAALVLASLLLPALRARSLGVRRDPVLLPLALLWASGALSCLACAARGGNLSEAFWPLLLSASSIALYAGAANRPGDDRFFRESLPRAVIATACAVAAYGLLQRAGIDAWLFGPSANPDAEAGSSLGGRTFAGEYQAVVFPLALSVLAAAGTWRGRAAAGGAVLLVGAHLLVTGARGAWAGAAAGAVLLAVLGLTGRTGPDRQRVLSPRAVAGMGIAMLGIAVLAQTVHAVDWVGRLRDACAPVAGRDTGFVRVELWKSTLRMTAVHPVLGAGPGQYAIAIVPHRSLEEMQVSGAGREAGDMAHNDFLQRLAETGALGAAVVVLALYAIVRKSIARLRGQPDRASVLRNAGLLSGALSAAVSGLVGNPLGQPAVAGLVFLFLGWAGREGDAAVPVRSVSLVSVRRIAAWLVLAAMAAGAVRGWTLVPSDAFYARGLRQYRASLRLSDAPRRQRTDAARASLLLARALDPGRWELYRALGLVELSDGSPSARGKALSYLARALELNPNDPETWNALGLARRQAEMRREGLEAFERAVALDPVSRNPQLNLALALEQDGRYDLAVDRYDRLLGVWPCDADALFGAGHAHAQLGHYDVAANAFFEAARHGYRRGGTGARAEVLRLDSLKAFRESEAGQAWLRQGP